MMLSPHNFPSILFKEMIDENPVFQLRESKTYFISTLNKCRIMFALICFDMWTCFYIFELKKEKFHIYTKYIENCGAMRSSAHSFAYIDCSRNVSLKITKIQTFVSSLFFIRFTSNCHRSIPNVLLFLLN